MSAVDCAVSAVDCAVSAVDCVVSAVDCVVSAVDCAVSAVDCAVSAVECVALAVDCVVFSVACVVFADDCAVSRSVGQLFTCEFVVPDQKPCHYWILFVSSQSGTLELKQNVYCVKSSVSGLLSAAVIFTTQQTPSLKSP